MSDLTGSGSGYSSGHGGATHTVTAFFHDRSDAEEAVQSLIDEGFARESVRLVPGNERDSEATSTQTRAPEEDTGFWASLRDLFIPDEDRYTYAEGLRRGGYLVTVSTTAENHERAVDILDDEGTIDMDEQEETWRSQGWTGYTGSGATRSDTANLTGSSGLSGTTPSGSTGMAGRSSMGASGSTGDAGMGSGSGLGLTGSSGLSTDRAAGGVGTTGSGMPAIDATDVASTDSSYSRGGPDADRDVAGRGLTGSGLTGAASSDRDDSARTGTVETAGLGGEREEVIPIVEEQLRVGKRVAGGGRVRVRSYVVEEPVTEDVALRQERVHVERRPVDREVTGDTDPFRERSIEVDERSEEAVVSKEARVREELVVGKDVETRTETVSDTVRRTEVEVEDSRGDTVRDTGTTGTTRDPRRS